MKTRMKTQSLADAAHSIGLTINDLRAAMEDASKADEQFAWLLLEATLGDAARLQQKLTRIMEAAQ